MHDIRLIRDNPEDFDTAMAKRGLDPQADALIKLDAKRREATARLQEIETTRNSKSKEIGKAKASGDEDLFNQLRSDVEALKRRMEEESEAVRYAEELLNQHLAALPNRPHQDVPVGEDEDSNEEVRGWGEPREMDFDPKDHVDLAEGLGGLDFEKAAAMSGARFTVMSGPVARLHRALAQFMLAVQTSEHDYLEINPPFMVRDDALFGTGQLPKFAEDLFRADDHWLIPTAEVPLTNLARDAIHDENALPMRFTAHTPCFRSEAGSAGRDTRGLIRMHQFEKVELVSIVKPDESEAELERMTQCAEEILRRLDLPYRVMLLSSGDMGFGAQKTYDLEVWLPSQKTYREISSCSNCGDFQARRMNARYRKEGEKKPEFVHTLNGSGLAVGRALVALLENHQQADGSIKIPEALQPYMDGLEVLKPA